ncbi:MAG: DUF3459 domain-containing protein, partial [Candidatus Sulfotelmatobacter sp.]
EWELSNRTMLSLLANLKNVSLTGVNVPSGEIVYVSDDAVNGCLQQHALPPWSVAWFVRT